MKYINGVAYTHSIPYFLYCFKKIIIAISIICTNSDDEEDSDEAEEEEEEEEEDDDEEETSEKADSTLDTSKEEKVDMSKLTKSQKRRLKKKLQQQKEPQVNGVDKAKVFFSFHMYILNELLFSEEIYVKFSKLYFFWHIWTKLEGNIFTMCTH